MALIKSYRMSRERLFVDGFMVPDTIQYAMNSGSGTVDQPLKEAASVLVLARNASDAEREGCAGFLAEQEVSKSKAICVTVSESPDSRLSLWQQDLDDEMPDEAIIVDAGSELPARHRQQHTVRLPQPRVYPVEGVHQRDRPRSRRRSGSGDGHPRRPRYRHLGSSRAGSVTASSRWRLR